MPLPLLNKRAKEAIRKIRKTDGDVNRGDEFYDCGWTDGTNACCGVVEGYGWYATPKDDLKELKKSILESIAFGINPTNRLMMYNAPMMKSYLPVIKIFKSLGFKEVASNWKNGIHKERKQGLCTLICYLDI